MGLGRAYASATSFLCQKKVTARLTADFQASLEVGGEVKVEEGPRVGAHQGHIIGLSYGGHTDGPMSSPRPEPLVMTSSAPFTSWNWSLEETLPCSTPTVSQLGPMITFPCST